MRRMMTLGTIAVLIIACVGIAQAQCYQPKTGAWRVGGSYEILTDNDASDLLGNGWNVEVERSFANVLKGDLAGTFTYRRFDKDITIGGEVPLNFNNTLNNYDVGVKWRGGKGVTTGADGLYYGAGLGLSFLDSEVFGNSDNTTKLSWRLLAGADFAKSWYGEVSYGDPGSVQGLDMNHFALTVGYRF